MMSNLMLNLEKLGKRKFLKIFFEKIDLECAMWRSATWHQLGNKVETCILQFLKDFSA